jgi:predicted secreted Zn-dependent protease
MLTRTRNLVFQKQKKLFVTGLLSLMVSAISALPAFAETNISRSFETFLIGGTSIEGIWKEVSIKGIRDPLGIRRIGFTSFKQTIASKFITKNGRCHLTSVTVNFHSNVKVPRWTGAKASSRDVQIYWKALSSDVERHELDHVLIAEAAIKKLDQALSALKPRKNCKAFNRKIAQLEKISRNKLNRAQNAFERKEVRAQNKRLQKLIAKLSANNS